MTIKSKFFNSRYKRRWGQGMHLDCYNVLDRALYINRTLFGWIIIIIIIIIIESIVPSRNIGCLWVLSTYVYQLLGTLVHSSFYPLPWLPIFSSCFSVFLSSCVLEGSKVGPPLILFHPLFLIHLNFLFLISKFISSCPVTFRRSLLEIIFGHHILSIYLRHLFTKVCILRWISYCLGEPLPKPFAFMVPAKRKAVVQDTDSVRTRAVLLKVVVNFALVRLRTERKYE